ncbi:DUF6332 family protein [Streptomyces sp. V4-01]|uniref:DUF6332 family protein n=1 Tax=Actinacidiphila polyblastidii TaxID=3110430 RepID=A0ABU7PGN1_9ACTN|nr:DUF6332 family protein [Streptomyces sp. V4-01]
MHQGRTSAERDARTVEMIYAAFTGALLAAAGFLAVCGPVLAGDAHGAARKGWLTGAVVAATAAFCWRVARTLRRFEHRLSDTDADARQPDGPDSGAQEAADTEPRVPRQRRPAAGDRERPPDQPSQPGRTSPDS